MTLVWGGHGVPEPLPCEQSPLSLRWRAQHALATAPKESGAKEEKEDRRKERGSRGGERGWWEEAREEGEEEGEEGGEDVGEGKIK